MRIVAISVGFRSRTNSATITAYETRQEIGGLGLKDVKKESGSGDEDVREGI